MVLRSAHGQSASSGRTTTRRRTTSAVLWRGICHLVQAMAAARPVAASWRGWRIWRAAMAAWRAWRAALVLPNMPSTGTRWSRRPSAACTGPRGRPAAAAAGRARSCITSAIPSRLSRRSPPSSRTSAPSACPSRRLSTCSPRPGLATTLRCPSRSRRRPHSRYRPSSSHAPWPCISSSWSSRLRSRRGTTRPSSYGVSARTPTSRATPTE
mmetsp:Transcript_68744/g.201296  ORF Transcript_68744/g.201296 Transcript_68744/m.201296 type:complete len:211 (-) Transcript_68744:1501-2133(-)